MYFTLFLHHMENGRLCTVFFFSLDTVERLRTKARQNSSVDFDIPPVKYQDSRVVKHLFCYANAWEICH